MDNEPVVIFKLIYKARIVYPSYETEKKEKNIHDWPEKYIFLAILCC
jgi:hypothetical protein